MPAAHGRVGSRGEKARNGARRQREPEGILTEGAAAKRISIRFVGADALIGPPLNEAFR